MRRKAKREFRHLQIRVAATGAVYIDIYEPFTAPDYFDVIIGQCRSAQITAAQAGGLQLADSPFYLLRCPSCSAELTTNRLAGTSLTCQRCRASVEVVPPREPALERLKSRLDGILGRQNQSLGGFELLLVLQVLPQESFPTPPDEKMRDLNALLVRHGVELVPRTHSGVLLALTEGFSRGVFRTDLPWIGGLWRYPPGSQGSTETTPEPVLSLLDEARRLLLPVQLASLTQTYDPASAEPSALLWQDRPDDLEDRLRRGAANQDNAPFWVFLSNNAAIKGDFERAQNCARSAVDADPTYAAGWSHLAAIRLRKGDISAAITAAEQARRLDPTDPAACEILAAGYSQKGREREASEMAARARVLRLPERPV